MKIRNKLTSLSSFILLVLVIIHAFRYKANPELFNSGTIFYLKMLFFSISIILALSTLIISVLYIQRQNYQKFKISTLVATYSIALIGLSAFIDQVTLKSLT